MSWDGPETRVILNADLTRYHSHLRPGATGTLLPRVQVGPFGGQDRFGAVRFDCCGATLDVLLAGLTIGQGSAEAAVACFECGAVDGCDCGRYERGCC